MTKKLQVMPEEKRKAGVLEFKPIELNTYQKSVKDEKDNFKKEDFLRIYRDMLIIRNFEEMLNTVKLTGEYEGLAYHYPGPAHLAIGQEAAYVGQAYNLDINDFTFGSHRSHGEIIAKGLSAIDKLSDKELTDIMEGFFDSMIYDVVKKHSKAKTTKALAKDFLLYGVLAEIWAKTTGFNRGLGGSMHAFFTPFGIYPNNALVGGSADIATGAALYKKSNKKEGMVICNIGDGAIGCGPVYEAMNFAAMDQYTTLWEDGYKGGLPIVFNIFNNSYGMGGQTAGETMAYDVLARLGAGITPSQMYAERIDGMNPLAVIDAYKRKKDLILEGKGPILLDVITYRVSGHSPSDSSSYRTKEEIDAWIAADSIKEFKKQMLAAKAASAKEIEEIEVACKEDILNAVKLARDDEISPRMDLDKNPNILADMMFSNETISNMEEGRKPDVLMKKEDNSRVKQIAKKQRFGFDDKGKAYSKLKSYHLRDGIFEAMFEKFYEDPTMIAYGEDNRDWGGAFAVYRGLTEALPYHRFFNSPISEAAIVGTGVGYAMCGGRAVVELMYSDFLGRCGDEVFNQMSKWQAMSANVIKMPLILRMSVGSKYGAQHSQDWSAICAHIPGLKVVFPATPYDAKGLMNKALNGTDPVIFLESQRIYDVSEMFHEGGVPEGNYEIEIGDPDIKREGKDLTILSIGATLYRALDAADILKDKYGIEAEVIDARSIVPFDYEKVVESVKKTGRLIVTGDACERNSFMKELAHNVTELAFDYLDAPPVVVGSRNWITPAFELEDYFFPQASWIIDAVHEKILPLKGHVSKSNFTTLEKMRNAKLGI
ncbi:MAG: dehydrogenase [Clostridiales bacterium]|nr:dehydrogenase [Clostridiales bacterium]